MKRRGRRGFQLVELMLGFAIFTTAFLMILGVFPTSVKAIHQSRTVLLATHLGQFNIELARSQTWCVRENWLGAPADCSTAASVGSSASPPTSTIPTTKSFVSMINGTQEVITYTQQVTVSKPSTYLHDIRVQISWTDSSVGPTSSGAHYINLETMVGDI